MNHGVNNFIFRRARHDDVAAINNLCFREYGPEYPYPLVPERLERVDGRVAVDESGVIGFARSARCHNKLRLHEFGGLVVNPEYRRRSLGANLIDHHICRVSSMGNEALLSEPVCNDAATASQRLHERRGFKSLGIGVAKYPELKPDILGDQAETTTLVIRRFAGEGWNHRAVFIPPRYEYLSKMFGRVGGDRLLGSSFPGVVCHAPHQGKRLVGSSFVDIPLNWLESRSLITEYIDRGWRFSAFLPGLGLTEEGERFDYIRLYQPNGPVDFRKIHVIPSLEGLKEFMAEDFVS